MKVAVAIDSFKGSMTSMQAGNACKEGILAAARAHCDGGATAVRDRKPAADNMDVVVKPLADGGEGTVEALVEGMNGTYEYVTVTDPMGSHVKARYGILSDQTAVMEMAEASGITLVKEPLNPWKAASTGVGEMILDAVQKDAANLSLELAAVRRQRVASECYRHWAMISWMKTETYCHRFLPRWKKWCR